MREASGAQRNRDSLGKVKPGDLVFDVANYAVMVLALLVTVYPFLYLVFYSLSDPGRVGNDILLAPRGLNLSSYRVILSNAQVLHATVVSIARTALGPLLMVLVTAQAGYVMAERRFVLRRSLWKFFIVTMFVEGGLIPTYLLMRFLRLSGTFWIYIVPYLFGGAFNMILIKTYIEQLPVDLHEAARMDGANDLAIFYRVILPVITPVIAAVLLFSAVGHWNSYIDTVLYNAEKPELHTLQYVLMILLDRYGYATSIREIQDKASKGEILLAPFTLQTTMTVVAIIPILVVYPFLQKYFAKGLLIGAIKS